MQFGVYNNHVKQISFTPLIMKTISKIELVLLYDTYGMLLTDRQQHILSSYCNYDCSLSEISEQMGISRQAVRDSIVKAEHSMVHLEQCLSVVANRTIVAKVHSALSGGDVATATQLLDALLEE